MSFLLNETDEVFHIVLEMYCFLFKVVTCRKCQFFASSHVYNMSCISVRKDYQEVDILF